MRYKHEGQPHRRPNYWSPPSVLFLTWNVPSWRTWEVTTIQRKSDPQDQHCTKAWASFLSGRWAASCHVSDDCWSFKPQNDQRYFARVLPLAIIHTTTYEVQVALSLGAPCTYIRVAWKNQFWGNFPIRETWAKSGLNYGPSWASVLGRFLRYYQTREQAIN